jgi:20S proteasome alpha/beta subunit
LKAKNGVVLVVEKKLSSILVDEDSYHKITNLSEHIGK